MDANHVFDAAEEMFRSDREAANRIKDSIANAVSNEDWLSATLNALDLSEQMGWLGPERANLYGQHAAVYAHLHFTATMEKLSKDGYTVYNTPQQ